MFGAGIVLLIFGIIGLLIGNGLRGQGGDALAFIELPFLVGGLAMTVIGAVMCLGGLL